MELLLKKSFFRRSPEAIQVNGVFLDVGMDVQSAFPPFFGKVVVGRKGYLDPVADAVNVENDEVRRFVGDGAGKQSNHDDSGQRARG